MTSTEKVAKKFATLLIEEIGIDSMCEVIKDNSNARGVYCASHNYCDSNMVMLTAMVKVLNKSEDVVTESVVNGDGEEFKIWNDAWGLANKNNFWIS